MSAFTTAELDYLQTQRLGRLATVGPDGTPHATPVGFLYDPADDTIRSPWRTRRCARPWPTRATCECCPASSHHYHLRPALIWGGDQHDCDQHPGPPGSAAGRPVVVEL